MLPFSLLALASITVAYQTGNISDYAPTRNVACPSEPLLREFTAGNASLHPQEQAFISGKETNVLPGAWDSWIGNASQIGYNSSSFGGNFSKIGIAISGGGYRAAQYGAGVMSAIDARNNSGKEAGTGGLLQVATYWSGLSGGSWLTGSLIMNDWPTTSDLVYGNGGNLSGWILDLNLAAPNGLDVFDSQNQAFYSGIIGSCIDKANAGFATSISDPWARTISYHFLNQTTRANFFTNDSGHGAGELWSNIPQVPSYQQFTAPFPIVVIDSKPFGSNFTAIPPLNQTVYEVTPLELGSWDPSLSAMVNLTYAGTNLTNGQPDSATSCVTGFDQAGFIMGTSASLFDQIINKGEGTLNGFGDDGKGLLYMLDQLLKNTDTNADDVANWPNPFRGIKPSTFQDTNSPQLDLIDGGLNLENVPLSPLFLKLRGLDTIVAVDGSADTVDSWPNASSIITTAARVSTVLQTTHQQFPPIPATADDIVSMGINLRPTFFGCDPNNHASPEWPLVIYVPNSPPLTGADPASNTGTFKLQYTPKETEVFLDQVHSNTIGGFLPNSNSPDPNWGKCLQCAAVDRVRFKQNVTVRSKICQSCFTQYCFDPAHPPTLSQLPGRKLTLVDPDPQNLGSWVKRHKGLVIGVVIAAAAVLLLFIGSIVWCCRRRKASKAIYAKGNFNTTDSSYEMPEHHQ